MCNVVGKRWRDASSLIVLSKQNAESVKSRPKTDVNYDILLQTRTHSASFPNSVVFPGGAYEAADADSEWIRVFKSFGYSQSDFDGFHRAGSYVTPLFQSDPIKRQTALRITAIRETFEELGLLLCSTERKKNKDNIWASTIRDIDVKHWQKRVHQNPGELLTLCKEYGCYPDIWSLHYWENWLTPAREKVRFDAAFYVTALEKRIELKCNHEVVKVEWSSPLEVIDKSNKLEVQLYPPQYYEFKRLSHFKDIEELIKYAKERSPYCNELQYPNIIKAKDGILFALPGDDLFPSDIDYNREYEIIDKTLLELRERCFVLHRYERTGTEARLVLQNYKPKHHVDMGDKVLQVKAIL